jgi:hypothetical protein
VHTLEKKVIGVDPVTTYLEDVNLIDIPLRLHQADK